MKPFRIRMMAKPSELRDGMIITNLFSLDEMKEEKIINSLDDIETFATDLATRFAKPCVVWICAANASDRKPRGFEQICRALGSKFFNGNEE